MEYDEYRAMNTTIQVAAEGKRNDLVPGFQQVRRFIAESEARFSRFREDSELCQLNRSAGRWFTASAGLLELMQQALDLYWLTEGLFDPSILTALQQAGYDRSIDIIRKVGAGPVAPVLLPTASRLDQVSLDPDRSAIYLPAGVQIDLGGIAKGWIAEKALSLMATFTPACAVSAGGDMAFHGFPAGEQSLAGISWKTPETRRTCWRCLMCAQAPWLPPASPAGAGCKPGRRGTISSIHARVARRMCNGSASVRALRMPPRLKRLPKPS